MKSTQLHKSSLFNIIPKLEIYTGITKNKHQMMVMTMIILAFIFNRGLKSENTNSQIEKKYFLKKWKRRVIISRKQQCTNQCNENEIVLKWQVEI